MYASREFHFRIRNDPDEFICQVLLTPLKTCIIDLFENCGRDVEETNNSKANLLEHKLHQTTLVNVSKLMNIVEEIFYLRSKSIASIRDEKINDADYTAMLPNLLCCGVDMLWLSDCDASRQAFKVLLESSFLPSLVMFCLRFLDTDAAHVIDEDTTLARSYGIQDKMSMGSLLLLRLSKFFQNSIVCLNSMSRRVSDLKKSVMESGFEELERVDGNQALKPVEKLLDERETLEGHFFAMTSSLLMLCTGEEVPTIAFGRRFECLLKSYPDVFEVADGSTENISYMLLSARHHWSTQVCKLFEPLLMEMVAEDGHGSSRVGCSVQCLMLADRHQHIISSHGHFRHGYTSFCKIGLSRGSVYYAGLFRIMRSREVLYSTPTTHKSYLKAQQQFLSTFLYFVPVTLLSDSFLSKDLIGESASRELSSNVFKVSDDHIFNPDSALLQNAQLLLDLRAPAILQSFLGSRSNISVVECIFKICARVLSLCCSLPVSYLSQDPMMTLGIEFTTCEWVQGIVECLRDVKMIPNTSECFQLGIKCLYLMSVNTSWLRYWPICDVLQFLLLSKKRLLKYNILETGYLRKLIDQTLRQLSIKKHSYVSAAVSMRLLSQGLEATLTSKNSHGDTLLDSAKPQPIQSLLIEAQDMSFGSTLTEQKIFTQELMMWLSFTFPVSSSIEKGKGLSPVVDASHRDSFWKSCSELITVMTQWMPTMLLPMEVEDSNEGDRKQRAKDSASVLMDQVTVIERILLYAMVAEERERVGLLSLVIGALWCSPAESIKALDELCDREDDCWPTSHLGDSCADPSLTEGGLLFLLRHLDLAVVLSEHFLCSKLYCHIVSVLVQLISVCPSEELGVLSGLGIVPACLQFIFHGVEVMRSIVPRTALHASFKQMYPTMVSTMRSIWSCCLMSGNPAIYEAILASDVIRVLIEEWLPDTSNLGLKSSNGSRTDSVDFQPMMIRFEAALMLRLLTVQPVEKLVYELSCRVASAGTVKKEMLKLKSTSTKQGATMSRSSAVSVLATLAQFDVELVNIDMQVCVLFQCVYFSGSTTSLVIISLVIFCPLLGMPCAFSFIAHCRKVRVTASLLHGLVAKMGFPRSQTEEFARSW
jgi:hypothetical protein